MVCFACAQTDVGAKKTESTKKNNCFLGALCAVLFGALLLFFLMLFAVSVCPIRCFVWCSFAAPAQCGHELDIHLPGMNIPP